MIAVSVDHRADPLFARGEGEHLIPVNPIVLIDEVAGMSGCGCLRGEL